MSVPLFRILCLLSAGVAVLGALWATGVGLMRVADPTIPNFSNNFYLYTFSYFEPLSLYATAGFFLGLFLFWQTLTNAGEGGCKQLLSRKLPVCVAAVIVILACLGRFYIHQNFDLCIDEYLNEFEAKILQHHQIAAEVPTEWVSYQNAMKVGYQNFHGDSNQGYWASGFLPGFAFLDYLFDSVALGWSLNPVLAGLSLLFLAALARRAWPDDSAFAANIAVLLLASSPQFLIMAFTKFAWPAHLCGTLFWVWLFTHPKKLYFLSTPIVGAILIGLHQPQVHLLVAAPFMLRLVYAFRWQASLWFAAWYLLGLLAWYHVYVILRPTLAGPGGELANMGFPVLLSLFVTCCHAITLYAWMTPLLFPLVLMAAITWKTQPPLVQDSLLAAMLTFLFYLSFPHLQGHGWGYRYMHSAYGLLALAGAGGAVKLSQHYKDTSVVKLVMCSLLFSLFVQIPYRCYEVRTMVRPLAKTWAYIASRPYDFIIIQTSQFWYACDLIRNDPWLKQKPLVFDAERLTTEQINDLNHKGTVIIIGANQVRAFGVIISDPDKKLSTK
jgi:hypothetical protein